MGVDLSNLPTVVLTLVLAAAMFVAGFLVIDGLQNDVACASGYSLNAGTNLCELDSNTSVTITPTFAGNATLDISEGMGNVSEYIPTVGTILGVSLILGVVIVGFAFGKKKGWF